MKNRKISQGVLALAIGLAAAAAHAGGPTVYGQFNVSVDQLDNDTDSALNVSSNSSRVGIKGDIDIQEGLKAIYQVETEIRADSGNGGTFASRDTFVGLDGGFGTARAGRFDTPIKVIGRRVDLFGDQVGDARNLTRGGPAPARFDERPNNSVGYATPAFAGAQGIFQYSTNSDVNTAANNDNETISLAVHYANGPAFIGAGYEAVGNTTANQDDPSIIRVGGYYDLANFRITALWQTVSGTVPENDQDVFGLGARYRSDAWTLKAQVYQLSADADNADATLLAIGAEYALAKPVTLYLTYGTVDNDDARSLTPYAEGRGDNGLAPVAGGDTASGISFGTIVRF